MLNPNAWKLNINTARFLISSFINVLSSHFFWNLRPKNSLIEHGYLVQENFIERQECKELIEVFDQYVSGKILKDNGKGYIWEKKTFDGTDPNVTQFYHIDKAVPFLNRKYKPKIEQIASELVGKTARVNRFMIYKDLPDHLTKRGFHSDNTYPTMKFFTYLTNCKETKNGPFTIIPRTHNRYLGRKLINFFINIIQRRRIDELQIFPKEMGKPIVGNAGDGILSIQNCAHRGGSDHIEKTRYMLVCYIALEGFPNFNV